MPLTRKEILHAFGSSAEAERVRDALTKPFRELK
jgi:hypothetical protein